MAIVGPVLVDSVTKFTTWADVMSFRAFTGGWQARKTIERLIGTAHDYGEFRPLGSPGARRKTWSVPIEIGGPPGNRTPNLRIKSPVFKQTGATLRNGKLNRSTILVVCNCLLLSRFEYAV